MIIIGGNGYLGSFLNYKYKCTSVISNSNKQILNYQIKYSEFLNNWNNNLYNNKIILLCADYNNNTNIINDLILNSHNNNKIILFSSAVIYNGIQKYEYQETEIINNNKSDNNYISTIKLNENLILKLNGKKIIIRLGTLYGYSPYLNATRGINRMLFASLINDKIIIDNLNLKKSMTLLEDIYNAINIILHNINSDFEIYNISSFNITINEIAKVISNQYNIPIEYNNNNNDYNYEFYLNNNKCKKLGWIPTESLDFSNFIKNIYKCKQIKYYDGKDNIIIWYIKNECRVCENNNLSLIINLGNQTPPNRLSDTLWEFIKFPLKLNICNNCYHLQLSGVMNPIIMYKNYPYLSGTSNTMKEYFKSFVNKIDNNNNIKNKNILDIACNDGTLLDYFMDKGYNTFGIDPAINIISQIKKHTLICDFFNDKSINKLDRKFDIVTAFNVFAHIDNIYEFLNNIYKITTKDSDIYIQTSQCNMIENNEFDTIYHEHLSFFNINSMSLIFKKSNLYLYNVEIVNVHGFSYLFHLKHKYDNYIINHSIIKRLNYEIKLQLYSQLTYVNYSNKIIYNWKEQLIKLLIDQKYIIGVGASAKGITILNFIYNDIINNKININCIIDENKLKINKIINSINLIINNFEYIQNINNNITFILFAWNFKEELIIKIKNLRYNNNDKFIILFPNPQII